MCRGGPWNGAGLSQDTFHPLSFSQPPLSCWLRGQQPVGRAGAAQELVALWNGCGFSTVLCFGQVTRLSTLPCGSFQRQSTAEEGGRGEG